MKISCSFLFSNFQIRNLFSFIQAKATNLKSNATKLLPTLNFMKTLFSKKLIYQLTRIRIFAIAFLLGISAFWIWHSQNQPQPTQNAFIVKFPPEPPKSESVLQDRNIADYEQLNISNCIGGFTVEEYQKCLNSLDKGREFILKHWKEKERAYIIYSWTRGDTGGNTHIFIEPDNSGNWHIISRWKTFYTTVGWENLFKVNSTEAFSVKRSRKTTDDDTNTGGKFYLKFFDTNGEQIDIL